MGRTRWTKPGFHGLSLALLLSGLGFSVLWAEVPPPKPPGVASDTLKARAPRKKGLERPLKAAPPARVVPPTRGVLVQPVAPPPLGFTGPSGVAPRELQQTSHFVPVEDRW